MPNRLPPCVFCASRKRHLPESCPDAPEEAKRAFTGIRNDSGGVSVADLLPPLRRIVQVFEKLVQEGKLP